MKPTLQQPIIGGLTLEVIERLKKRNAVTETGDWINAYLLNTEELKIELDELIVEHGITPFLHTFYVAPEGTWREPLAENPTYYQIPFRSLVPGKVPNLVLAGRMLDTDSIAYSAIRVMVNMNQTGEAAGVACVLALKRNASIGAVNPASLRETLAAGGSIML